MRCLFVLLTLFLPISAFGQENDDSVIPEIIDMLATSPDTEATGEEDPFGFILPAGFEPDDKTMTSIQEAVRGFYDYRTEAFQHRLGVFWWQQVSSQIIFFVVILIVGVGLYFSWLQFNTANDKSTMGVTNLELGRTGIKISSPVLGVIILALSLVFFYLYLVHVYPVSDVF